MKNVFRTLLFGFALLMIPVLAHAQGGCVDSPEAPTDVLMLVGSIGMVYGSSVVTKMLRRKSRLREQSQL
jgi:XrtJ-associated TM-motif-TM protein